ncbi:Uncharacterised protein [Mycobacteroides abscessus subsp. abscessus]|nr:Uncharacterised protein [Mycobacteroides abscessus subsp. abscessus]
MIKSAVGIAVIAVALAFAPSAGADPDPFIPDGASNWCPGGTHSEYGGVLNCLGAPYPDGTFFAQSRHAGTGGFFSPSRWENFALCMRWSNGTLQGAPNDAGVCGGRRDIDL